MSKSSRENPDLRGRAQSRAGSRELLKSSAGSRELKSPAGSGMHRYWRIACLILVIEIIVLAVCNYLMLGSLRKDAGRQYRVDISRAATELENVVSATGIPAADLQYSRGENAGAAVGNFDITKYPSLIRIGAFDGDKVINNDYEVRRISGSLMCFEYEIKPDLHPLIYMNIGIVLAILITVAVLLYVGKKILKPFHQMSNLSVEIARGNLSAPIGEEKSRFFGRFLWGINMLRDNIETNKERELELQKDKKTLILSLSHDIKTPLSAIKLYARALDEDIYDTEEKRRDAISGIAHNAAEIEKYVADIVTASKEDFLNLEVTMGEVYLKEIMDRIQALYTDKFAAQRTKFTIENYTNVLLSGDSARLEEVLQNLLENAIKYGDGKWVKISFSDEEDCRLITVTNSGCSIKEEEASHIFESFYRGSNSENVSGSGLGLYIARSLMRMMNGEIYCTCKAPESFSVTMVVKKA